MTHDEDTLTPLEAKVLFVALASEGSMYEVLRAQALRLRVLGRVKTGHGFFTNLHVPSGVAVAEPQDIEFEDVVGLNADGSPAVGFTVFVRSGRLAQIEGFAYDERWPSNEPGLRVVSANAWPDGQA